MKTPILIYLAVEDELSEHVLRRVLCSRVRKYTVGAVYCKGGASYLKKQAAAFNQAARTCPYLLLTDLDRDPCPSALLSSWLPVPRNPNFLFRVAVREVESWLLADAESLSRFLGLRAISGVDLPEALADPKSRLLNFAMRSPQRRIRESLVDREEPCGRLIQGPDYNGVLASYVRQSWDPARAVKKCRSLARLIHALERLEREYTAFD